MKHICISWLGTLITRERLNFDNFHLATPRSLALWYCGSPLLLRFVLGWASTVDFWYPVLLNETPLVLLQLAWDPPSEVLLQYVYLMRDNQRNLIHCYYQWIPKSLRW